MARSVRHDDLPDVSQRLRPVSLTVTHHGVAPMCRKDCVQFLVIYGVFMAGFVQGFAALSTVVGSARMVRIAYNMQRSGVRPSVRLSVPSFGGGVWRVCC